MAWQDQHLSHLYSQEATQQSEMLTRLRCKQLVSKKWAKQVWALDRRNFRYNQLNKRWARQNIIHMLLVPLIFPKLRTKCGDWRILINGIRQIQHLKCLRLLAHSTTTPWAQIRPSKLSSVREAMTNLLGCIPETVWNCSIRKGLQSKKIRIKVRH